MFHFLFGLILYVFLIKEKYICLSLNYPLQAVIRRQNDELEGTYKIAVFENIACIVTSLVFTTTYTLLACFCV